MTPWGFRTGVLAVAVPGLALAALGLHHHLLQLLAVLGSALPALVVPMAVEARGRRRGARPQTVPAWTWLPASAAAVLLTGAGVLWTPVLGLALAAAATAAWRRSTRVGITRPYHPSREGETDAQAQPLR